MLAKEYDPNASHNHNAEFGYRRALK
jgi:hypothetical protein